MGFVRKAAASIVLIGACSLLIAASAAAGPRFQAEDYPATASGQQSGAHVLSVENGIEIECATATFALAASEPEEVEDAAPEYKSCTAFASGFEVEAKVKLEGCTYNLDVGEELEADEFEGTMDIVCPVGKSIVFEAGTCEIQVGAQNGLSKLEYINNVESSPPDLTVEANLTKVKYTKTKDGFLCPLSGTGAKEDGTYTGDELLKASYEAQAQPLAVMQGILCKKTPDGKGVCPKGEEYVGKITGTIASGFAKIEKTLTEYVTCNKVTFEGNYPAKAEGNGEKFLIEGSKTEKECESTLPGNPKVTVSMLDLPATSYFEYKLITGGFQGTFHLGSKVGGPRLQLVIGALTCKYKMTKGATGFVANAGTGPTTSLVGAPYSGEATNNKNCPTSVAFSVMLGFMRGMDNVYLAKKVAV